MLVNRSWIFLSQLLEVRYFPGEGNFGVTEFGVKVYETRFHDTLTKEGPKNCVTE